MGARLVQSRRLRKLRNRLAVAVAVALALGALAGHATAASLNATGAWALAPVGHAPTPPMGWNSWNAFGVNVNEARVMGAARALVADGLAKAGYRYVNIDDGWWLQRRASDGRMIIRTSLFPSAAVGGAGLTSFRPFTDKLHAMGLEAGIYSDLGRNVCSQAWSPDNPNLPVGNRAEREVGLYGHVTQDISLYFKDWGFDYIKVDACGIAHYGANGAGGKQGKFRVFPPLMVDQNTAQSNIPAVRALYARVRDALRAVRPDGRFVLSLCNWGAANVRAWGKDVGTMWRTSTDIQANWSRMLHSFDSVSTREMYSGPGRWNDPDMLEVGNGDFDQHHLLQARSHFSLWAIEDAPLLIGYDLRKAPQSIIDILGAPEVIAVNQDPAGNQGVLEYTSSDYQIIVKTLSRRGEKAVALFNRTDEAAKIELNSAHLKMVADAPITVRDLWARRDLGSFTGSRVFTVRPHEVLMLKVSGKPLLASGYYLSEMTGRINVADDGVLVPEEDPTIHRPLDPYTGSTGSDGTRPVYAGWGDPRADSTPYDDTLRIANVSYRYGIGALANSRLQVQAEGGFTRFSAQVGIDDTTRGRAAPVRFEVYGDGKLLAVSRPMHFNEAAAPLRADVAGVKVVELIARQIGTDQGAVVVTWANAALE